MEEKNDIGMNHHAHAHLLILNENYIAQKGDVCCFCQEQIDSCKSFVYSCGNISSTTSTSSGVGNRCSKFLLHKTCAELPPKIVNPTNKNQFLYFNSFPVCSFCRLCLLSWEWFYRSTTYTAKVCFKCVVLLFQQSKKDPKIEHPGHNHPLALIEHPSSFKCYACEVNDNVLDLSYRCTECQFWMHKSCGDAPPSFQFQFHKHPLVLSFSLPQNYRRFGQNCRLCHERLNAQSWLYCCGSCRFFTHFHCARSSPVLSLTESETCPNVVQLPAFDELSLNTLLEQFIKDKITDSYNNSSISSTTNYIKHWSHEEHDLKLITINELYDEKYDDEILLLCDGCGQPIRTSQSLFYGCAPCKYFMHKVCAEFPREIEHYLWPRESKKITANKYSQPFDLFLCYGCGVFFNGIYFRDHVKSVHLHIGCVTLPEVIKHEAHPHQLQLVKDGDNDNEDECNACGHYTVTMYGCKKCKFYVCGRCIMKARTYKHRWDPHPLDLIYDAGMVEEHEHEFDCEFCSEEINTNNWFYHCSKCDLSFHTFCILDSSYHLYQYVKFGATDIKIEGQVHPHGLTFVLNKKAGRCMNCKRQSLGKPVLLCAPCNRTIFCYNIRGEWCRPELGPKSYIYPPCINLDNIHMWKWKL